MHSLVIMTLVAPWHPLSHDHDQRAETCEAREMYEADEPGGIRLGPRQAMPG